MGKVTSDMTMSLDGFITGPNDSARLGLGEGGERLQSGVRPRSMRPTFTDLGGKTELVLHQAGHMPEEQYEKLKEGYGAFFDRLDEHLAHA